jgi:hypothetical protein
MLAFRAFAVAVYNRRGFVWNARGLAAMWRVLRARVTSRISY